MRVPASKVLKDHDPTKGFTGEDLPPGDYVAVLTKVEDKTSNDGKTDWISCWFQVTEGDFQNRIYFGSIFAPINDEKYKQFSTTLHSWFGIDIREYPDVDVTELLQQFVQGPNNPTAPVFFVRLKESKTINKNTGKPYVNGYVSFYTGQSVKSPTRGGVPNIPGVPSTSGGPSIPTTPQIPSTQGEPSGAIPRPPQSPLLAQG